MSSDSASASTLTGPASILTGPAKYGVEELVRANYPVWWKCPNTHSARCRHEFCASISALWTSNDAADACMFCRGQALCCGQNSLAVRFPEIAAEWKECKEKRWPPPDALDLPDSDYDGDDSKEEACG